MKNNLLCIDEYRNNPEFYFSKSLRYADRNNLKDALKNLHKALELEPDNCEYKFNIACFLSEMRRHKEANKVFNDILLNYDPTMFECYFGLGCNSFELGDNEKAAEYFEKYLYFDRDGEFCEEVAELVFYLKVYENVSHSNQFEMRSNASLRYAKKYFGENKLNNAIRELCKSISSFPFNVEARNLLTLTLLEQQNYERADNICTTVRLIDKYNVWANCLCIYVLSHSRKHSRAKKFLETLILGEINNREDLLCIVTTLIVFNRVDELILLLEIYINQYADQLIFSTLLLGYCLTQNIEKFNEIYNVLLAVGKGNNELMRWLECIKGHALALSIDKIIAIDEYCELFNIFDEDRNPMYDPFRYQELYSKLHDPKPKLSKKYMPIIDCAIKHREIMYIQQYRKEIICLLNNSIKGNEKPLNIEENGIEAYSAALEYNYCNLYFIECEKKDLIKKYGISSMLLEGALRDLQFDIGNKLII